MLGLLVAGMVTLVPAGLVGTSGLVVAGVLCFLTLSR